MLNTDNKDQVGPHAKPALIYLYMLLRLPSSIAYGLLKYISYQLLLPVLLSSTF